MRIRERLNKLTTFDLIKWVVSGYKHIPSVYKSTFWTVFVVLNIVFAYHTAHFIFGNHEWAYMRTGVTWRQFWYEARFTETIPYALFGFELLPILQNLFTFAGMTCSCLAVAIYWDIPKTKFAYTAFCLTMAVIPYNLSWLYHVAQASFVWGASIIVLAFISFEKFIKGKTHWSINILTIFLLWFTLGLSAAFINTIFILSIGRLITELLKNAKLTYLLKKYLLLFADILIAAVLLKICIYLADKYGYLGDDFYNVNTIKISEIFSKFMVVIKYCIEQFTYTYPFFEAPILGVLLGMSVASLVTIFVMLPNKSFARIIFLILALAAMLFATQLAIFISENRIKLQFMFRLTGYFSLYFVFAFMLSILLTYWKIPLFRSILLILVVMMSAMFIQRDMYAMRIWKQGLDAENKLYDHVMVQIESMPEFSYNKKYDIVIIGDKSLRERYYVGKYKDGDASLLAWSYRAPWTYGEYFNFYAPKSFVRNGFQNTWNFEWVNKLFPLLSKESIQYILDNAATWPKKGSIMIRDGIIFIFMEEGKTKVFQKLLRTYYKDYLDFNKTNATKKIRAYHPDWGQEDDLIFVTASRVIRSRDAATVLRKKDNLITLKWDNYGVETFILNDKNVYVYNNDKEKIYNDETIMASHPDWGEPEPLKFMPRNQIIRESNGDIAIIVKYTDKELILDWFAYGRERFVKDENNIYCFEE